ncbi:MAG: DNA adenine methylase [Pirellulales bacterium]|nr:DNA adenine methylase [Pirellulales bacterium]
MMEPSTLVPDMATDAPVTEGVKYAGSKLKLLPYILQLARKVEAKTVFDGFSGTSRVSQAFAKSGYQVISNDLAVWSEVFGTCYLLNKKKRSQYEALIRHLNAVKPIDGWFTEHYGGLPNRGHSKGDSPIFVDTKIGTVPPCAVQPDGLKKPWQIHNTRKLDAVREEIDRLDLPPVEKAVALTSLILALDRVDSTLGHFVSYLQEWSPRSYQELTLRIPKVFVNEQDHKIFRRDIFDLVSQVEADLAYYDPPYGSNNDKMPPSRVRYAAYYHLWTTICLNDRPELFGKAKRRRDTSDTVAASVFEEFRRGGNGQFLAVEAIQRLITATRARWILLSYSSGGRATAEELFEVLENAGRVLDVVEVDYKKNVMAGMKWTHQWVRDTERPNHEFLFLIEKR